MATSQLFAARRDVAIVRAGDLRETQFIDGTNPWDS